MLSIFNQRIKRSLSVIKSGLSVIKNSLTGWRSESTLLWSVAFIFAVFFYSSGNTMPGDLGDPRLNNYILEHFYLWVTGSVPSYWNAPFFVPYHGVMAFSETMIGSAPLYAVCRSVGLDKETALQCWYLLSFVVNGLASHFALRRMGLAGWSCAVGVVIFTFGLPVLVREGHVQLAYRCGVPLACFYFYQALTRRSLRPLLLTIIFTSWQLIAGFYIGVFLLIVLAALAVSTLIISPRPVGGTPTGEYKAGWIREITANRQLLFWTSVSLLVTSLILMKYAAVASQYDIKRPLTELYSMLPRPTSYFIADHSLWWGSISQKLGGIPMRHEHNLFIGVVPFFLLALGCLLAVTTRRRQAVQVMIIVIAIILASITLYNGLSLYYKFAEITNFTAVRALTRIVLVLLFPVAFVAAAGFEALSVRLQRRGCRAVSTLLVVLLVLEIVSVTHGTSSKKEWQQRARHLTDQVIGNHGKKPSLLFVTRAAALPGADELVELDAMHAAQNLGIETINGYSGFEPSALTALDHCDTAFGRLIGGLATISSTTPFDYQSKAGQLMVLGRTPCDPMWYISPPGKRSYTTGPLAPDQIGKVSASILKTEVFDGSVVAHIAIRNDSDTVLASVSSGRASPISISWQFREKFTDKPLTGWDPRWRLPWDVSPHGSSAFVVTVVPPETAGKFQLCFSIVQDGVAWFHDLGLRPPCVSVERGGQQLRVEP